AGHVGVVLVVALVRDAPGRAEARLTQVRERGVQTAGARQDAHLAHRRLGLPARVVHHRAALRAIAPRRVLQPTPETPREQSSTLAPRSLPCLIAPPSPFPVAACAPAPRSLHPCSAFALPSRAAAEGATTWLTSRPPSPRSLRSARGTRTARR